MDIIARMRARFFIVSVTLVLGLLNLAAGGQTQQRQRLNNVIDLLDQKKPVFGVYAPSNATGRARSGAATPAPAAEKAPIELAKEALAYHAADFLFSGSMESGVDRALPAFTAFVRAMNDAGALEKRPFPRLPAPLIIKTPKIADSAASAVANIGRQLNLGVSGIMFVEVESADEVRTGLAAMRFKSKGGTRADAVGMAPAYWGMSEQAYKQKADLWPLNPDGELINWTIVESKEGLAHVREIAAVKGIGVLWPGAGTLRGVFSSTNAAGERVFDVAGWEQAIQQVLAACKEFKVPCGFPATASDIELRMKQGFNVFVMGWSDAGFKAVEVGRAAAGRSPTQ
jgi:2-keto-3-deoxy-L-rhamnonate aldolase RhmA